MGYRRFKLVNQARHIDVRCPNPPLEDKYFDMTFDDFMSGPFGEETTRPMAYNRRDNRETLQLGRQQATRLSYEASGCLWGVPLHRVHHLLKWTYNTPPVRMFRKAYSTLLRERLADGSISTRDTVNSASRSATRSQRR